MDKKIFYLVGCISLLILVGCIEVTETATPITPVYFDDDQSFGPTTLQGVNSPNNTSVRLYFSNPVSDAMADASLFKILRPQLCDGENWNAQLTVKAAKLSDDGRVLTLTTAPQSSITYRLILTGILDDWGFPVETTGDTASQMSFAGTPSSQAVDTDKDGVSDADEQLGWAVRIAAGEDAISCQDVNSDPDIADTDGDSVPDNVEMGYVIDPRSPDSDRDNLGDYAEIYQFFSSPLLSDTDGDSLLDGMEAQLGISPALADTDGDGLDDFVEVSSGGTDPRQADLPELKLDLYGSPSIILNMTYGKDQTKDRIETTLDQDREEQVNTDNTSTKMSIENTVKLHTEVSVSTGIGGWPPSAKAELTTDTEFKHGYFHETSSNWTKSSVNESQNKFEGKTAERTNINYSDGMIWVPMKITNNSNLSFKIKDLRVIAYRILPNGSFSAVGTLTPGAKNTTGTGQERKDTWVQSSLCADPADPATCGNVLGPGSEIVLVMGADSLPAQEMVALVSNPSALMFDVSSYSLFQLDEWGVTETVNYALLGESIIQRTGIVVIDYGDGTVERHMVATNVQRNPDSSGKGIALREALRLVGTTDFELCEDGKTLCRVKNQAAFRCDYETLPQQVPQDFCHPLTRPGNLEASREITTTLPITPSIPLGFWIVAGSGPEFGTGEKLDFNTITLTNGERISLVYMLDSDGDGIFDREEYLLGTDKLDTDSDDDELSDYLETKVGWTVKVQGLIPYQVFPDPRFQDFDGDYLTDLTEESIHTDPRSWDTDGDGISDSIDPNPITPPCLDRGILAMANWWNASSTITEGSQTARTVPQDWKGIASDKVFSFNVASKVTKDAREYISIKDADSFTNREFTVSAWIKWEGPTTDASQATILTKGLFIKDTKYPTYSLSILRDGRLKFTIYRNIQIGFCYFRAACDSNFDTTRTTTGVVELETSGPVVAPSRPDKQSEWTLVTATFGGETMRIFVNGVKQAEKSTTESGGRGLFKYRISTSSLVRNTDPLLIGLDNTSTPTSPYRGVMDDIQFFTQMLGTEEVGLLYQLGICTP